MQMRIENQEEPAADAKPNGKVANGAAPNGKADDPAEGADSKSAAKRKRVIDKVRKLLALAYGPGAQPGEARAASDSARKLMAEHGIRIEEVYGAEGYDAGDPEGQRPKPRPECWPDPVKGLDLIMDIQKILKRHVIMQPEHHTACALWVLHAHCHDSAT